MYKTWGIIGSGVAGITAVAKLLEIGIKGDNIHWVCKDFCVGDLSKKWKNVSGNTTVNRLKKSLLEYGSFELHKKQNEFDIFKLQDSDTCYLKDIVTPLEYSTQQLLKKVNIYKNTANSVDSINNRVLIKLCNEQTIQVDKVIVAIGSEPKSALYKDIEEIKLETALNPNSLKHTVNHNDKIAVFGSSHSAVLILKSLVEIGVNKIFNFYLEDIKYAIETPKGIINDNTGLKGIAAKWSEKYLESNLVPNLLRVKSTSDNIDKFLPQVDKAVYPIGFERRKLLINGLGNRDYNKNTGEIIKNVYGFGIAYPCLKKDLSGEKEYQVGFGKFIKQIDECINIWNR